ncbi:hypothetical protein ONR49_25470, partial [Salmonella enterica subsp. enterica serovar Virginia]|nr:hypothetical protein [Salmonella enterica subsp. enterica serovar Virginia]
VCRLYQRAVSHSIIRVQNSDRRRNLFNAECCFWIEPACVQAGHDGAISAEIAAQALDMLNVDAEGFDYMDRKLLLAVIDKFFGG